MSRSIPVVGIGLVSSLGAGVSSVFEKMLAGEVGVRPLTRFPAKDYAQPNGGQAPDDLAATLEEQYPDDDPALRFIKAAASEAFSGLGLTPAGVAAEAGAIASADPQLGLVLGTNFGLMETLEWCWRERIETGRLDEATFDVQQAVTEMVAAWVGAGGPRAQVSLSCASGAAAVDVARDWLLGGRATRVLVVCYDSLTEFAWCGLSNLRTISTDALRPFDTKRAGTIFSEGAAAVLLSLRPEDGARALATVLGSATNNNAFHLTAPCKAGAGSRRVMAAALAEAEVAPDQVELVSAHATGTTANDVTESAAIAELGAGKAPVVAFKGNLGHMLGAAGLAEMVLAIEAQRHGRAPAVAGLREFDTACPVTVVRDAPRAGAYSTMLTNSAGIGGNNASIVIGPASRRPTLAEPLAIPSDAAGATVWLRACGWVLPGAVGGGAGLPTELPGLAGGALDGASMTATLTALAGRNEELTGFNVKPFIESVKGYLDPAGAFALAAASLARRSGGDAPTDGDATAVVACTRYGAAQSGYAFYQQFIEKGARFASPMIFPHGYSNTASNLVAIEFNYGGAHLVYDRAGSVDNALWSAADHLRRGRARDVFVLAVEGAPATTLPDGAAVLHGALCLWLTADPLAGTSGEPWTCTPDTAAHDAATPESLGMVAAMLKRLALQRR